MDPRHRRHAKQSHKEVSASRLPQGSFPLAVQQATNKVINMPRQDFSSYNMPKYTCKILSSENLHIISQRLRTAASDAGLIPVPLY